MLFGVPSMQVREMPLDPVHGGVQLVVGIRHATATGDLRGRGWQVLMAPVPAIDVGPDLVDLALQRLVRHGGFKGARLFGALHVAGHRHRQIRDQLLPFREVFVGGDAQAFEVGDVLGAQHVEVQVVVTERFVEELADQEHRTFGPDIGVQVEALYQVRGQVGEVVFALIKVGIDAGRQLEGAIAGQARLFHATDLRHGRIKQGHTAAFVFLRQGLFIQH